MQLKSISKAQTLANSAKRQIDLLMNKDVKELPRLHLPFFLSVITAKSAGYCANKLRLIERDNPNIDIEQLLTKFYQEI